MTATRTVLTRVKPHAYLDVLLYVTSTKLHSRKPCWKTEFASWFWIKGRVPGFGLIEHIIVYISTVRRNFVSLAQCGSRTFAYNVEFVETATSNTLQSSCFSAAFGECALKAQCKQKRILPCTVFKYEIFSTTIAHLIKYNALKVISSTKQMPGKRLRET